MSLRAFDLAISTKQFRLVLPALYCREVDAREQRLAEVHGDVVIMGAIFETNGAFSILSHRSVFLQY